MLQTGLKIRGLGSVSLGKEIISCDVWAAGEVAQLGADRDPVARRRQMPNIAEWQLQDIDSGSSYADIFYPRRYGNQRYSIIVSPEGYSIIVSPNG